ncbi:hypothetical protein CR513_02487, partial [Mucuna pruriens]
MANPSGNHEEQTTHVASSSFNGNLVADTSPTALAMKHNPGVSLDWSPQEQTILEEGLSLFASEPNLTRYAKIALNLNNKTVRDVALRVRWMNKKENCKRRKDENIFSRKSKDKKEKVSNPAARSSHFTAQPSVSPYAPAMMMDNDDDISDKSIGGPTGELLEQNAQALNKISTNLAALQFQDNINLFSQTRDSIVKILNDMNDMPEMNQMPPLPFKINETIFNSILPNTNHQMQ